MQLGCEWLAGRENKDQWKYVWEALLARPQVLPEGWSEQRLVQLGCEWLAGRENKDQWNYVWQALLVHPWDLPEGWSEQCLVKQGCEWLAGREDKDQWAFVWQDLLARPQVLPEGWSEQCLVKQGCEWLDGRGNKELWNYVWQALLARSQKLPEGWDVSRLADMGLTVIAQPLQGNIALPILKGLLVQIGELSVTQQKTLETKLADWIPRLGTLDAGPASHLIEAMLDAGMIGSEVFRNMAMAWCESSRRHPSWPLVLVKCLIAWPTERGLLDLANELSLWVGQHPNAGWLYKAEILLQPTNLGLVEPAFAALISAVRERKQNPLWAQLDQWLERGQVVPAIVTAHGRQVTVEIAGGLYAVFDRTAPHLRRGQQVQVVPMRVERSRDRIVVRQSLDSADLPKVGQIVEGDITGHQPYGVFVRVMGRSGLIQPISLPLDQSDWVHQLPLHSKWHVRIIKHTSKGFNAVVVNPPWDGL